MRDRAYQAAVVACGAALCGYLMLAVGPATIGASFRELSWRLLVVTVFPCVVVKALDTLAWHFSFAAPAAPLSRLAAAFVAGQAVASTTPTGLLGADAVMAWMLRGKVALRDSVPSLIIAQTTSTMAQGIFLLAGILVARSTFRPSMVYVRIMEWLLVLEAIGVVGFVAAQVTGVLAQGSGILGRLGVSAAARLGNGAMAADRALVAFYRQQPTRLALSVGCNLLAWIASTAETWLILSFLGAPVSVTTALVIEAFGTGISFATFFLPTQLGVDEGGAVATFVTLGLSAGTGLSLGLVRRVREAVWVALGLLLVVGKPRPTPAALRAQAV